MSIMRMIGVCLVLLCLASVTLACGAPTEPSIKVEEPWARPAMVMNEPDQALGEMPEQGKVMPGTGAVFMQLINKGQEADRLIGGRTDVAQVVEVHETVMDDDMMKMRMLADGLEIPARGEVLLKPGGYHIMLVGMLRELRVGDTFTLELEFEKSEPITVQPTVHEP